MHRLPSVLWAITQNTHAFYMMTVTEQAFIDADTFQLPSPFVIANIDIADLRHPTTEQWCNLPMFLWPQHRPCNPSPTPTQALPSSTPNTGWQDPHRGTKRDHSKVALQPTGQSKANARRKNTLQHPLLCDLWAKIPSTSRCRHLRNVMDAAGGAKYNDLQHALGNLHKSACLRSIIAGDSAGICQMDHSKVKITEGQAQAVVSLLKPGVLKIAQSHA